MEGQRYTLFLSAPTPILGGANEKFCIGNVCGSRGRISGPVFIGKTCDERVDYGREDWAS